MTIYTEKKATTQLGPNHTTAKTTILTTFSLKGNGIDKALAKLDLSAAERHPPSPLFNFESTQSVGLV